jgi:hypothetical protein
MPNLGAEIGNLTEADPRALARLCRHGASARIQEREKLVTPFGFFNLYEAERRRSREEQIAFDRRNGELFAAIGRLGKTRKPRQRNHGRVRLHQAPTCAVGPAAEHILPQEATAGHRSL